VIALRRVGARVEHDVIPTARMAQSWQLVTALKGEALLPSKATDDGLHLALASVHGVGFLLTCSRRHLANAELAFPIREELARRGYRPPVICTPEELLGV